MPTFNVSPCAALAIAACIAWRECELEKTAEEEQAEIEEEGEPKVLSPLDALKAQLDFITASAADLKKKLDDSNACFITAIACAFEEAGHTLPPVGLLPQLPESVQNILDCVEGLQDALDNMRVVPQIPGVNVTYAADGKTPLSISF